MRLAPLCYLLGSLAALAQESPPPASATAPAAAVQNPDGAPAGFHYETNRHRGLFFTGIGVLAGGYVLSAAVAITGESTRPNPNEVNFNPHQYLLWLIPVVGPIVQSATAKELTPADAIIGWMSSILFSGIQIVGVALTAFGIPTTHQLVADPEATVRASDPPPLRWSVVPGAPGAPLGLSLSLFN